MIFVFDLDDTICDADGYSEKYIQDFINKNKLTYKKIAENTRFAEQKFSWSQKEALKWYKTYGDDMTENFPVCENVKEVFNFLRLNGHKIIIATARAKDWHKSPKKITRNWLLKNKIPCDLLLFRKDKENVCFEYDADVFVDDDLNLVEKTIEKFKNKKEIKVFLSTTNYNKNFQVPQNLQRIYNIKDILKFLF